MNAKWFAIALSAAALLFTAAARADDAFYIGGDIGEHAKHTIDTQADGPRWRWTTDNGFAGFVRLGYRPASDWRIELEGGYRAARINSIRANLLFIPLLVPAGGIQLLDVGGHINQTSVMANLLYDIPLGWRVQPFVGVGAGLVHTDVSAHAKYPFCPICAGPALCIPGCTLPESAGGTNDQVALQAEGGLSMALDDRFTLDATYHYLRTQNLTWSTVGFFSPGTFRADLADSTVTIGVRYAFSD